MSQKTKIYWVPTKNEPIKSYRTPMVFIQGVHNHPNVEFVDDDTDADYVFYHHLAYANGVEYRGYRKNIIAIDMQDRVNLDILPQHNVLATFVRTWVKSRMGSNGYWVKEPMDWPDNTYPISYGIFDQFLLPKQEGEREIDLGCYLRSNQDNRKKLLKFLKRHYDRSFVTRMFGRWRKRWGNSKPVCHIGPVNTSLRDVFDREYLSYLRNTKIVVTLNPDHRDGDSRTWEAFASGALVFVDQLYNVDYHPLRDGEHCIFFDPNDENRLIERLDYYLTHSVEASEIARNGYEFTMAYHRNKNRIDDILSVVSKSEGLRQKAFWLDAKT